MKYLLKFGQSHPNEQAEFLYVHNGRKGLTRKVIQTAEIIKNAHIENLKAYEYIAIAIDAEKMGSKHILDVIISNVFSKEAPLNFKTFYNFTGTAEAYKDAIKETVNELNEIGFTVSGIVADNLKVQWDALNSAMNEFPNIRAIACGCHTLNLGIMDFTENPQFDEFISAIKKFSSLFGTVSISARLGVKCPSFCETRWTILSDITKWILLQNFVRFYIQKPII